jgi:hypothetical protein
MDQNKVNELLVAGALKEIDKGKTGEQYIDPIREWMRQNAPNFWK